MRKFHVNVRQKSYTYGRLTVEAENIDQARKLVYMLEDQDELNNLVHWDDYEDGDGIEVDDIYEEE